MKKVLIILFFAALAACTTIKPVAVKSKIIDLKQYADKGFIITTGELHDYTPISIVVATSFERTEKNKGALNPYDWSSGSVSIVAANADEAINEAYNTSVKLGANALMKIVIEEQAKQVIVTGLAVKLK